MARGAERAAAAAAAHSARAASWTKTSWRQLMGPYRRRTGGAPWLAEIATQAVFDAFNGEMADLARRGGVSSWLFT